MNYIDKIAGDIGDRCGMSMAQTEDRRILRIYAVLCTAKGLSTTSEDVHDAWCAWRSETMPEHDALVPFEQLDEATQYLDAEYRDAIKAVARLRQKDPHDDTIGTLQPGDESVIECSTLRDGSRAGDPPYANRLFQIADNGATYWVIAADWERAIDLVKQQPDRDDFDDDPYLEHPMDARNADHLEFRFSDGATCSIWNAFDMCLDHEQIMSCSEWP